jgi:hypothetical protein
MRPMNRNMRYWPARKSSTPLASSHGHGGRGYRRCWIGSTGTAKHRKKAPETGAFFLWKRFFAQYQADRPPITFFQKWRFLAIKSAL